jgi:hypothetical protein
MRADHGSTRMNADDTNQELRRLKTGETAAL